MQGIAPAEPVGHAGPTVGADPASFAESHWVPAFAGTTNSRNPVLQCNHRWTLTASTAAFSRSTIKSSSESLTMNGGASIT